MPSNIKYLLIDDESLAHYSHGTFPDFDDIKRRILLKAREQNTFLPDHYYRLAQEESFREVLTISDIHTEAMYNLSADYLEIAEGKISVQPHQQNNWQELITYIPPLILQCSYLYKKVPLNYKADNILFYYRTYILPNTRFTCIPSPIIPQLDYYVNKQGGLHDLHMHLNGALETDQVWQDYMFNPNAIYNDLESAFGIPKVKEQLEQESHLLSPTTYIKLLKAAQKMRNFFFSYMFSNEAENDFDGTKQTLLAKFINNNSDYQGGYRHPFISLISNENTYPYLMSIEGLMYILVLNEIDTNKNETLASFFHFYLLILGLTNRLLVQQTHQNGFEQFQKHTLNGLREQSEKIYLRRYFQMHGNEQRNISFLEGRFSPKSSERELVNLINGIWKGWEKLQIGIRNIKQSENDTSRNPMLKLIAHFIKAKEKDVDLFIRHKKLRYEVWEKARVLHLLLKNHPKYKNMVMGVDAAASEFDAPPEVFAPAFRLMRQSGIKHFTYHAGEDFHHIISGLRAIYEAIVFCDLRNGDRIGHATASALSPELWQNEVGNSILIRQGELLDNFIFVYHLIVEFKIELLQKLIPFIINRVQNLSYNIYNNQYTINILEKAWLMRQCCPAHTLESDKKNVKLKPVFDQKEWDFVITTGFVDKRSDIRDNKSCDIFRKYHDKEYRKEIDRIITIDPFEIVSVEDIKVLQLELLAEMNKREIVIETLPTSNVRIGYHRNFSSYHLWNWIKWKDEGKRIPPIVVGSDDTGIFATNIYNEYANIYCMLLNTYKLSHNKVMEVIKELDNDSQIYRFD